MALAAARCLSVMATVGITGDVRWGAGLAKERPPQLPRGQDLSEPFRGTFSSIRARRPFAAPRGPLLASTYCYMTSLRRVDPVLATNKTSLKHGLTFAFDQLPNSMQFTEPQPSAVPPRTTRGFLSHKRGKCPVVYETSAFTV
jgi:hypothetical protein